MKLLAWTTIEANSSGDEKQFCLINYDLFTSELIGHARAIPIIQAIVFEHTPLNNKLIIVYSTVLQLSFYCPSTVLLLTFNCPSTVLQLSFY